MIDLFSPFSRARNIPVPRTNKQHVPPQRLPPCARASSHTRAPPSIRTAGPTTAPRAARPLTRMADSGGLSSLNCRLYDGAHHEDIHIHIPQRGVETGGEAVGIHFPTPPHEIVTFFPPSSLHFANFIFVWVLNNMTSTKRTHPSPP